MSKSPITCHVLDSSLGKPAAGVDVTIHAFDSLDSSPMLYASGQTDADGRCMQLTPASGSSSDMQLEAGKLYKATFITKSYFERTGRKCFYPWVEITFEVENPEEHYHIPLLISPYSYTTYRGS